MNAGPAAEASQPAPAQQPAAPDPPEEPGQKGAQSLGRVFSHRAAQPGGTGERLGAERDARSNFTGSSILAGKVVGGDEITYITTTATRTQLRLVDLSAEDLELNAVFVRPPGFGVVEAASHARRVLILRGPAETGRYALARHVLLALATPVRRLHPETDLGALTAADLKPGGYLLADLAPQCAARLHAFDLDRLGAELDTGHKLVITVVDSVHFADPDMERHIVDVRLPDVTAVLEAHLGRVLKSRDQAITILRDAAVITLCREQLREAKPGVAVRLAQLLAEARDPIAETVRVRLNVRQIPDLESWFSSLTDLATQTLAIGISVLGGEPYELVAAAAEMLKQRLEPADQPPQVPSPFGATRGSRLRALNAHLVPSDMPARHGGTAPGLVVRYQDRGLARPLLLHVWDEYDELRSELLTWLRLCARSEVPTIRVRAAVAAGILAARAFDHIRATIILPWARAAEPELRDAAASALGVAADRPELRNAVLGLVGAWSADDSSPRLQATAVRAWRVELGSGADALGTVSLLDRLGGGDDAVVIEAICESIAEMLEFQDGAFASDALTLLVKWVTSRSPERRINARLAFLLAAADLVREMPGGGFQPALLDLSEGDHRSAAKIAELWSAALNSADLHLAAKDVLAEWARLVDSSFAGSAALGRLMGATATTYRTDRIIGIAASGWSHAPRSAAAVLAAISTGRSTR